MASIYDIPSGQAVRVTYRKRIEKGGHNFERVISETLTLGTRYDNKSAVIEGRANGTLPEENAGLANGQEWWNDREDSRYIIGTKTGRLSLRVAVQVGTMTSATYYRDGLEVGADEWDAAQPASARRGYCSACAKTKGTKRGDFQACEAEGDEREAHKPAPRTVFSIGLDNIDRVEWRGESVDFIPEGWTI